MWPFSKKAPPPALPLPAVQPGPVETSFGVFIRDRPGLSIKTAYNVQEIYERATLMKETLMKVPNGLGGIFFQCRMDLIDAVTCIPEEEKPDARRK